MKVGVLANSNSWYLRDLTRAASAHHTIVPLEFSRLSARLDGRGGEQFFAGEIPLADIDVLLVRTMPPGSLEQVIVRMDMLARLAENGKLVLNPPRSIEVAVDKYLTSAKLQAVGLQSPITYACQTADEAMQAFAALGNDCVLKPLFGSEGRGITRLTDEALALRAFKMLSQMGAVLYLQEFIPHQGFDIRLFVLGETVLGMRRHNLEDWRTNISRGATGEAFTPEPKLQELALRAAQSIGAEIAGVDFLPGNDGNLYAIEVNAVPGWQALSRTLKIDIAAEVLNYAESRLGSRESEASIP